MRRKFKRIAAAAMATAMALSVAACGGSKKDSDKIILGYMGPLTGESALWGEVESNTLKMLVEETNANGGIIGKQIELKIYDNRGDAVETTNAARKALQNDGVVAFIGPDSSSGAIALAEVCEEYKVPHITTTGTNYKVTQREEDGSVRPYAFRICLSDPQLGDIMGGYAKDKLGYQKVAILYEISSEYSLGITQNFTNSFEAKGGQVTITEAYKTGDVDFRAQLSKIKENGDFDALMIPANYKEVGLIAKQARSLGIEVPFLGVDAWMMQDLFEIAKDEVQGAVFPCAMDVNDESLQEFKNAFQEKWNMDPDKGGTDAYLAYDCFELVKYAIETAGEADPQKIRDAMENAKDVQCLTSVISMDPQTHNPVRTASIFQIQGTDFAPHGYPHAVRLVGHQNFLGDSRALLAEHQIAVRPVGGLGVEPVRLGGGKIQVADRLGIAVQEVLVIGVDLHVQLIPVVQPRALDGFLVELEAQGFDQMEPGAGGHAGAADVAGVGRHLGLQKYNVHHLNHAFPSRRLTKRPMRPKASFKFSRE